MTRKGGNSLKRVFESLATMDGLQISIGIHDDVGGDVHHDSGLTIAEMGRVHDLGTNRVPMRPWLSSLVFANNAALGRAFDATANRVLDGAYLPAFQDFVTQAKDIALAWFDSEKWNSVPLSSRKLDYSGSRKALVDTGLLRSSISVALRNGSQYLIGPV